MHRRVIGQFVADFLGQVADSLIKDIADALEKQEGENVATELGVIDIAAQDVGGLFKECIQLGLCHAAEWDGERERVVRHAF